MRNLSENMRAEACYIGHPDDGNPQICRIAANTGLTSYSVTMCNTVTQDLPAAVPSCFILWLPLVLGPNSFLNCSYMLPTITSQLPE